MNPITYGLTHKLIECLTLLVRSSSYVALGYLSSYEEEVFFGVLSNDDWFGGLIDYSNEDTKSTYGVIVSIHSF